MFPRMGGVRNVRQSRSKLIGSVLISGRQRREFREAIRRILAVRDHQSQLQMFRIRGHPLALNSEPDTRQMSGFAEVCKTDQGSA